jgi:hypothetical protein
MRLFILIIAVLSASSVWAEKAGFYIGAGITSSNYMSPDDDDFNDIFEDEKTTGWRGEFGYIWDLGKPGGFHLGIAGAYDNFGKAEIEENFGYEYARASFEAQALSVMVVIEQELASWVDFVFKAGPASVNYDIGASYQFYYPVGGYYGDSDSQSETELGGTMIIGFTFFPTDFLAIELARQGMAYIESDSDDRYGAGTWSASLQYRF